MKFFIFVYLVFSLNLLQATTGGNATEPQVHKSIVNVVLANGICSGFVISKNAVLTAAHCIDTMGKKANLVAFIQPNERTKDCNISEVSQHLFVPGSETIFPLKVHSPDLALLKLKKPLCDAVPADLATQKLQAGDLVFAAGHGGSDGGYAQSSQVSLKIIPTQNLEDLVTLRTRIEEWLFELAPVSYTFALPQSPNSSVCEGDSGGPVYSNQNGQILVYGLNGAVLPHTDLGAKHCNSGYLHLITPLFPYLNWINETVETWAN